MPAEALIKDVPGVEYGDILVPVFGTKLDDDIVGTAGRPRTSDGPARSRRGWRWST